MPKGKQNPIPKPKTKSQIAMAKTVNAGTRNNETKAVLKAKIKSNENKYGGKVGDIKLMTSKNMSNDYTEQSKLIKEYKRRVGSKSK